MKRENPWSWRTLAIALSVIMTLVGTDSATAEEVPLVVATVAMNAVTDTDANLATYYRYMEQASAQGVHLILFPEASLQQNPCWRPQHGGSPTPTELDYLRSSAEPLPGSSSAAISDQARELNLFVIYGMTEKPADEDVLYTTVAMVGPEGVLGKHRKNPLGGAEIGYNEDEYWTPGDDDGMVDSPLGRAGLLSCIEFFYYKGLSRQQAGAQFVAGTSGWDMAQTSSYLNNINLSAKQTGLWHFVSNQAGSLGSYTFAGHSVIVDPDGNVVADTGIDEGMVVAETDIMIDPATLGFAVRDTPVRSRGWASFKALVR